MKIVSLTIILCLVFFALSAQNTNIKIDTLVKISKKSIKKEFKRILKKDPNNIGLYGSKIANQFDFLAIPSFIISENAIEYDSSKSITDYIIPNKIVPFEYAIIYKQNKYHGTLYTGTIRCSDVVLFGITENCNYMGPMDKDYGINSESNLKSNFEKILKLKLIRDFSFLFSVRYFRNCIWFIEHNKVFLLDLDDFKIYDPDDYIRQKCSSQIIKDLAVGKLTRFCD